MKKTLINYQVKPLNIKGVGDLNLLVLIVKLKVKNTNTINILNIDSWNLINLLVIVVSVLWYLKIQSKQKNN